MRVLDVKPHCANVSVVIPCYCCEDTIRRAVASVDQQTVRPLEVILVDDCSPDQTLKTLKSLQSDYPEGWIKVIESDANGGPGKARNRGWASASGAYVAFLDADDSWHPYKTEYQYSWMQEHVNAALSGQQSVQCDADVNVPTFTPHKVVFSRVGKKHLLLSNRFSTSSVMMKTALPYRFTELRSYSEDYELWCDVVFDGGACFVLSDALPLPHQAVFGASGLSSHLWEMEKGELLVFNKLYKNGKLGLICYVCCSGWSMLRYFRRYFKVKLAGC
jgi:glycosyltransferase involved in cell wall biosynthesis